MLRNLKTVLPLFSFKVESPNNEDQGLAKFGRCNHGNEVSQYRGSILFHTFYCTGVKKMVPISKECVCKVFFRLNIVNIPIFYNLRLIRGTADRGTMEPAEPSTEPKKMTVLLQLPIK